MAKQSGMTGSPLREWMADVIDGLGIHQRPGWEIVLGRAEEMIDQWVNGRSMPGPGDLNSITSVLARYGHRPGAVEALDRWTKLLSLSPSEAWGGWVPTEHPTLAAYVLAPLWERLHECVDFQAFEAQVALLRGFIREANERRLERR